jgi:tetratricopeptide (TPR) repeat protein
LEKAIDIKRRAQRCLQSGDLDGALTEYEKLTRAENSEPINLVLMGDLLYKKEDLPEASRRYLQAVDAYTGAGLYKNAIAVCKKMARLSLSLAVVLQRLAELHLLDGLSTEAALYYQGYAEHQAHERQFRGAADSLRKAFEASPENPRLLEKAAEWLLQAEDATASSELLIEASRQFARRGQSDDAARAQARAEELAPGADVAQEAQVTAEPAATAPPALAVGPTAGPAPEAVPPALAVSPTAGPAPEAAPPALALSPTAEPAPEATPPPAGELADGLEPRPTFERPPAGNAPPEEVPADVTPPAPAGLRFEPVPATCAIPATPELPDIDELLRLAAERFRKGEHDLAADALIEAARAYESLDRLESAAAIYRSLGRSTHATPEVLGLWLRNCEQRGEAREAAEVACGIGDRALNDGDLEGAREWFVRAMTHVPDHELAIRRLQKMGPSVPEAAPAGTNGSPDEITEPDGRVEVAIGRAQAVTLDLGSLIAEFQRGIESQLSGDAQSHYDLGMTYREMGLLEQALGCFRTAARNPAFGPRSAEMIGRCLLDQGHFDDAAEEFTRALEGLGESSEAGVCLRFQLGLAHEVAGHAPEALAEFERVYAVQPNYPDVAQKIRVLRRALESV